MTATADAAAFDPTAIELAHLRDRVAELEARIAALTNARDETFQENGDLHEEAADREDMLRRLRDKHGTLEADYARISGELAETRQRLRKAHDELATCHERIRRLRAGNPAPVDAKEMT